MKTKKIKYELNYTEIEADYTGIIITFRIWKNNKIEMKFDDNFAKANGYKNREDMLNKNFNMRENLILYCGMIPDWINVGENGDFTVKITQMNELLN